MTKIILYHGTSEVCAKEIEKEGFIPDKKYNWKIKSKKGFVYLSKAYAPFYAMNHSTEKLAIIKVEVDSENLYPEDDFIMYALGKKKYTQKELDAVNLEYYKPSWEQSLQHLGNVAAKPEHIKIIGIRYFNGHDLLYFCDPVIVPMNYKIMGEYYTNMSELLFQGTPVKELPHFEMG